MKLSTRADVESPADKVFAHLTNFGRFERMARDRGATVDRLDDGTDPAAAAWRAVFTFRGRERRSNLRVVEYETDQQLVLAGSGEGIDADIRLELVPLSPERTRLHGSIDMTPTTIKARLLVQSMKLAKGSLERRMERRMKKIARSIESA